MVKVRITASKMLAWAPMLAEGVSPSPPTSPAPRSDRTSPYRFGASSTYDGRMQYCQERLKLERILPMCRRCSFFYAANQHFSVRRIASLVLYAAENSRTWLRSTSGFRDSCSTTLSAVISLYLMWGYLPAGTHAFLAGLYMHVSTPSPS